MSRQNYTLYIYSPDLGRKLSEHNVTWERRASFCEDQFAAEQPEEFPTAPVTTFMYQPAPAPRSDIFERFNFDKEVEW